MNDNWKSTVSLQQTSGQILKAAREVKQISINDVAQSLLLSRKTVAALEEDDYSSIPAQVYAEGYLKAYARLVHVPVNTVLTGFRRLNAYSVAEPKIRIEQKRLSRTQVNKIQLLLGVIKERRIKLITLGLLFCFILGILIFFVIKQITGRKAEVISVPSVSESITRRHDKVVVEEPMPIVTTFPAEENEPVEIKNSKQRHNKKANKQGAQSTSLMFDTGEPKIETDAHEPELILTKPTN